MEQVKEKSNIMSVFEELEHNPLDMLATISGTS